MQENMTIYSLFVVESKCMNIIRVKSTLGVEIKDANDTASV